MSDIGNRFKEIRLNKHLGISAMAAVLGQKRQRIQDIESGKNGEVLSLIK
jgi:transcriptional regulator with XRE-family HTH domain